jgi:tRNA (guanine37-N1)-methyltransferase
VRFDVLTLFPDYFTGPFASSVLGRAALAELVEFHAHDIRAYAEGRHRVCDDYPYGGGAGMVMKPEPVFACAEAVAALDPRSGPVVLLTPSGRLFDQRVAEEYARHDRLTLICGHYEGVDERVREQLASDALSIGDYVLSGGEPAALAVLDAVARLVPGVLAADSLMEESHSAGLLEYPQYTRPAVFRGWDVPAILLSGHHAAVARWRRERALERTADLRPDLLAGATLTPAERAWLTQRAASPEAAHADDAADHPSNDENR